MTKKGSKSGKKKTQKVTDQQVKKNILLDQMLRSFLLNPEETVTKRLDRVAIECKVGRNTVDRARHKYGWDQKLIDQQNGVKLAEEASLDLQKTLLKTDVSFSEIIPTVKDFSYQMILTSRKLTDNAVMMIDFYTRQITELIDKRGGLEYLTEFEKKTLQVYQKDLRYHQSSIADFLRPHSIAGYLKLIGIETAAAQAPRDVDVAAFTPQALQEKLMEMGVIGNKGLLVMAAQFSNDLPDIKGTY